MGNLINCVLSEKVIELHEQGYELDFRLMGSSIISCLQDNLSYSFIDVKVAKIEENFDELSRTYKHLYKVDTCCGTKGLLVVETACPLKMRIRWMRIARWLQRYL